MFAKSLYYKDRPIEASLDAFNAARRSTAEILERLTEAEWLREGTAQRDGPLHHRAVAGNLRRPRARARRRRFKVARDAGKRRRGTDLSHAWSCRYDGIDQSERCRDRASVQHELSRTLEALRRLPRARDVARADASPRFARAASDDPARMSIGIFSASYWYGGGRHAKRSGRAARKAAVSSAAAGPAERWAVGDVKLEAPAAVLGVFLKCRLEHRRPEEHAGQSRCIQAVGKSFGHCPGRPGELERPGRAPSLRDVGPFEQHPPRIHDGAVQCRHVRRRHHPRRRRHPRDTSRGASPPSRTTSRSAPRPNSLLNRPASSPIVRPWRIGI